MAVKNRTSKSKPRFSDQAVTLNTIPPGRRLAVLAVVGGGDALSSGRWQHPLPPAAMQTDGACTQVDAEAGDESAM
jgi:hypothetical protein